MANSRKKILVTGASGLLGREICRQLCLDKHNYIVAVDNNWRYPGTIISDCTEFVSDNLDVFLKKTVNDFDYIYHMAAINGTSYFYKIPNQVLKNNTLADFAIFEFVESNRDSKLIYASSSEIIAGSTNFPTSEETSVYIENMHNARWSYRIPKILSENYLVNSDINFVIARFFNIFSEHSGPGHFIHDISNNIQKHNFQLISPDETRSFCYVADAVDALIRIASVVSGDVVNIGTDEELRIVDAANIVARALGHQDVNWRYLPSVTGSVQRRRPDLTTLKKYFPEYSPLTFKDAISKLYEQNSQR